MTRNITGRIYETNMGSKSMKTVYLIFNVEIWNLNEDVYTVDQLI